METYATALTYAIPFFVGLIIIEFGISKLMGKRVYHGMDTVSSLSSGLTNTLKSLVGLSVVIISYEWMVTEWALFEVETSIGLYLLCFVLMDFASYWSHRFNHKINFLWNRHAVHHSSEEFNLACALRQEISGIFGVYFFLYIPMAIIGIPTTVFAIVAPIHLFAQFWYHTRLIDNMGFLEHLIVTPSHHRVHHAINEVYLDKNLAAIFIVWDKLFGTFQEELPDEPPVYGTLKPAQTWNPVVINFQHIWRIIKDAWRTKNWGDKLRIWFMPTGWRPEDVAKKHPISIVEDVHNRPKYNPSTSVMLQSWSWFQLLFHNALIFFILFTFTDHTYNDLLWYVTFLFVSIFAYTALMDGHKFSFAVEILKFSLGMYFVVNLNGWFGVDEYIAGATNMMVVYMAVSLLLTLYFLYIEKRWSVLKAKL